MVQGFWKGDEVGQIEQNMKDDPVCGMCLLVARRRTFLRKAKDWIGLMMSDSVKMKDPGRDDSLLWLLVMIA